jgi:hypothetical protein
VIGLLATCAALLLTTPASGERIEGDPLDVDVTALGRMQVYLDGAPQMWTNGLAVRFLDGRLADRGFANWEEGGATLFDPVAESSSTSPGGLGRIDTTFAAGDVLRAVQTIRYEAGSRDVRVTYRVTNVGDAPVRFRAAAVGSSYSTGTGIARTVSGRRLVGIAPSGTDFELGMQDVSESRLPEDTAPVPVPAWSSDRSDDVYRLMEAVVGAGGLGSGVSSFASGAGGEWTGHATSGLAPGATARYEVVWRFAMLPPLTLTTPSNYRYVGASETVTAAVGGEDGRPAAGQTVRWRVSGATVTEERTAVTAANGTARLTYVGEHPGATTVEAWVDADRDGVRDAGEPARQSYAVSWDSPPPRLTLYPYGTTGQVGRPQSVAVYLRDAIGEPLEGDVARWTLAGANSTNVPGTVRTSAYGEGYVTIVPRYTGSDVLTVWADDDGDGVRDAGEPSDTRTLTWEPPPPPIELTAGAGYRAGQQLPVIAVLHDQFGIRRRDAAVRWSVSGITNRPPEVTRSDADGWASFTYTAPRSGTDTITAYADLDDDGARDAGEPVDSVDVRWEMAPPPAPTTTVLDGSPIQVSLSSTGRLGAERARPGSAPRTLTGCSGPCSDVSLRFSGGPLAGRTFSNSEGLPFYGDPQEPPVRTGDSITQKSSFRVRWDDVDHVRVHQAATYRDGDSRVRVSYRLENLSGAAHRVRLANVGSFLVGDTYWGDVVGSGGFIGGQDAESGLVSGLAEVAGSAWDGYGAGSAWELGWRLTSEAGLGDGPVPAQGNFGFAVQWPERDLGAGAEPAYAIDWIFEMPSALQLTPLRDVEETWHEHRVTATALDDAQLPRAGAQLRWEVEGVNPDSGSVTTSALGQTTIAWTSRKVGEDVLTVYADDDGDGARDADESSRTARVSWRAESAVDPPVADPLIAPSGQAVNLTVTGSADEPFFGLTPYQASQFPTCADGSAQVNMRLHVNVDTAGSTLVAGSMTLRTVDPLTGDLENPLSSSAPVGDAVHGTYTFVVECLRQTAMYLCYTLEEAGIPAEEFCVLLGGIGLWDPSGVVYDKAEYNERIAAGDTSEAARAAAAVQGAAVRLQRLTGSEWRQMLSGNPFMTPNVNPYPTLSDGRFGWAVPAGTYRVVVTADGYQAVTSRQVTVPPATMDLHVGLVRAGDEDPGEPGLPEAPTPEPTAEPTPTETPEAMPDAPPTATPDQQSDEGWTPYAPLPEAGGQYIPPPRAAPPAPAAPPAAPHAVKAAAKVTSSRLDGRGRLQLTLACPAGAAPCAGRYRLVTAKGSRALGSLRYSVAAGKRSRRTLELSARSRNALRASQGRVRLVPSAGAAVTIVVR